MPYGTAEIGGSFTAEHSILLCRIQCSARAAKYHIDQYMPQFAIPDSVKPAVKHLASLTPEGRGKINEALLAIPSNSDSMDIAMRLAEIIKLDPESALTLVQFYLGLLQGAQNYGVETVLSDFREALEREYPADWDTFFEGLKNVLESESLKAAYLFARAESIQSISDHAFLTANTVTSLIPFRVSDNLSAVVSHELKITYAHGARQDFFVITLSEKDIEFLQLILRKAQEFAGSIPHFVNDGKVKMLTHSEEPVTAI